MNDPCPVCGLIFERETGYFTGAMYVSYFLAVLILVPAYYGLCWLFPELNGIVTALIATLVYAPLTPAVFRYSRVLWIYFDRLFAPGETSSPEGWSRYRREQEGKE